MIRSRQTQKPKSNFWKIFSIFLICFTFITEIYLMVIIYQKNTIIDIRQAKINDLMSEVHQAGFQQKEKETKLKKKVAQQEILINSSNFISVKQFEFFKKTHDREINRLKREISRLKAKN